MKSDLKNKLSNINFKIIKKKNLKRNKETKKRAQKIINFNFLLMSTYLL